MEHFWNGFEKRALSPELLQRAAGAARSKATAAVAIHNIELYGKRMKQHVKFHNAANRKLTVKNQQEWNRKFIERMKEQGHPDPEKLLKDKGLL